MPILTILLVIIICGVLLWLVNVHVPMDPKFKQILNAAAVILIILWLLFIIFPGAMGTINSARVPTR